MSTCTGERSWVVAALANRELEGISAFAYDHNNDGCKRASRGLETPRRKTGSPKSHPICCFAERGKGDSVKEINDYWGDSGIEEIHKRVTDWKAKHDN